MTDSAGAVVHTRQYDAWGNLEQGADQPGYAFTGREWDPEIGLYYYRARYYDPKVGRFISEDPIGFEGGVNFYGYVENDPAMLSDPNGLAYLVTDVYGQKTTFYPWPESNDPPFTIETKNGVDSRSQPGADSGFISENPYHRYRGKSAPYGPNGSYIETNDPRGRDIHGGGSGLKDPYANKQGWRKTYGCTRGQNEDVNNLGWVIDNFRKRHPNAKITYIRSKGFAPRFDPPPITRHTLPQPTPTPAEP
jgi:RHS repeat-associated protein